MGHAAETARTLLARLEALHASAGPHTYRPETVTLLQGISAAARETAGALREGKRLEPGDGPSTAALQSQLAPARTHRAVDTLVRLDSDDRLAYLRRRSLVVQAADSAVVLALATRLLFGDRSVDRNPAGHAFTYARTHVLELWWHRLSAHLTPRSVIFQNACRFALGLAAARAIAGLPDLQHGFWVLLATLTLTRTTSLETWSAVRQALIGTLVGAVLAGGLLALVHDRITVYALVLPVVMLAAFIAGPLRGLAWAQGGFTLVVATLFAQVAPVTWQLAPVRLVDVLVGSVIGLTCGLLAWPRGAGSEVRRSMAALCSAIADAIGQTTTRVVEHSDAVGTPDTTVLMVNRALGLARESLAQYQCEPRHDVAGQPDWPAVLVAAADARRGERLLPGRPGRITHHEVGAWLRHAAGNTAADYRALAQHLRRHQGPPPTPPTPRHPGPSDVAPPIPRDGSDHDPRAVAAALLIDAVIWLDALTADLNRIHQELGRHRRRTGSRSSAIVMSPVVDGSSCGDTSAIADGCRAHRVQRLNGRSRSDARGAIRRTRTGERILWVSRHLRFSLGSAGCRTGAGPGPGRPARVARTPSLVGQPFGRPRRRFLRPRLREDSPGDSAEEKSEAAAL